MVGSISSTGEFRSRGSCPEPFRLLTCLHCLYSKPLQLKRKQGRFLSCPHSPTEGGTGVRFTSDPILLHTLLLTDGPWFSSTVLDL